MTKRFGGFFTRGERVLRPVRVAFAAGVLLTGQLLAQSAPGQAAPPANATLNQNPNKLETEVVMITDDGAFPDAITRKQGEFFLLLLNKTHTGRPKVIFDSTTAAAAVTQALGQGLNLPLLTGNRRLASVLNPPPGVYQIKRQADGRVLLTINIEK